MKAELMIFYVQVNSKHNLQREREEEEEEEILRSIECCIEYLRRRMRT